MNRAGMQHRDLKVKDYKAVRAENGDLYLEGHFAVFNSPYFLWENGIEYIMPGAFTKTLIDNPDVRALYNHNVDLILGRTKSGTLVLSEDETGLFARIKINPDDSEAMNAYERIKRGDIDQCSFGFDIVDEDYEYTDGKSIWKIKEVRLYEVSPCVFPAYEETSVSARKKSLEDIEKRKTQEWQQCQLRKLRGEQNNA